MKKTVAVAVITALMLPANVWAQEIRRESLRDAAARGGRELAAKTSSTAASRGWDQVRRLTSGTLIRVVRKDGTHRDVHFVAADDTRLVVVTAAALPADARAALLDLIRRFPGTLPVGGRRVLHEKLLLEASGVFFDGVRLAPLDAVEASIPRDDIGGIRIRGTNAAAAAGALVGGVLGGVVGFYTVAGLAMKPCPVGCAGRTAGMWLAGAGLPVAAAISGGLAFGRGDQWRTLY